MLLHCDRIISASFDSGIVGRDGDELARDAAEARDDAAAGDGLGGWFRESVFEVFFSRFERSRFFFSPSSSSASERQSVDGCVSAPFTYVLFSLSLLFSLTVEPVPSQRR